jgi:hypothetical protein
MATVTHWRGGAEAQVKGEAAEKVMAAFPTREYLACDIPTHFILSKVDLKMLHPYDSPSRKWNGNLTGPPKADGTPDMRCPPNFKVIGVETSVEFDRESAASQETAAIDCFDFHLKFQVKASSSRPDIEKFLNLNLQPVKATDSCLWDALHEAMIDAGILGESDELPSIKETCFAYLYSRDPKQRKPELNFIKNVSKFSFKQHKHDAAPQEKDIKQYQQAYCVEKGALWATPVEVYLAAQAYKCVIHLFHTEINGNKTHYCFKPEASRSKESPTDRSIFLRFEMNKDGKFWFQWYRPMTRIFRTSSLWEALFRWLQKVRPVSFTELGDSEKDFKSKCSSVLKSRPATDIFLNDCGYVRALRFCVSYNWHVPSSCRSGLKVLCGSIFCAH